MTTKNVSGGTSSFPEILTKLLELVQHGDDELSWEASLVLRFFFERECMSGCETWLIEVEAFLTFEDNLAIATDSQSIKELRISLKERDNFAYAVFRRIEQKVTNSWRHAFILKQATGVPGLQDCAADYLRAQWSNDEAVTLNLLYMIWPSELSVNFNATLTDIIENATTQELREHAVEMLRVSRELDDQRA